MRDATVAAPKQHRLQESLPTASKAHSACRPTDGNRARQSPCKHPYTKTHQSFKATPRGKPKFVYFNQSIPKPHASKPHASTCVTWCSSEWSEPHLTHMALQPLLDCNYTLPSFRFKSRIMTSLYSVWNCWLLVRWSSERVHT